MEQLLLRVWLFFCLALSIGGGRAAHQQSAKIIQGAAKYPGLSVQHTEIRSERAAQWCSWFERYFTYTSLQ